jgi:hypothetical protein
MAVTDSALIKQETQAVQKLLSDGRDTDIQNSVDTAVNNLEGSAQTDTTNPKGPDTTGDHSTLAFAPNPMVESAAFSDPVETAVVNFLLSDQNDAMTPDEKNNLKKQFISTDPNDTAAVRGKIKDTLEDCLLHPDRQRALDSFLKANAGNSPNVSKKDLTRYFSKSYCAATPSQGTAGSLTTTAAMPQLKGVVAGASMDGKGNANQSGPSVQTSAPQTNSTSAQNDDDRNACAISDSENSAGSSGLSPSGGSSEDLKPDIPNPGKKSGGGFKLKGEALRDSVATGALAGGIMGLLALGAAAGPAGVVGAIFIGCIFGFCYSALSKGSKKKKDDD